MINMIKKDKHITGFQYHNAILDVEGLLYDDMDGVQAFELTSITVTNNINLLEYLGFETVNDIERKAFSLIVQEAERKVCNEIVQQAGNKGLNAIVKEIDL